jgi:hypothetical protein
VPKFELYKHNDELFNIYYATKVWLQLAQWFLRRRFLCEFPIRSYVKLSSAVGGHLDRRAEPPELKKKSSPLKLLSQSQPIFAEMILGWSSSKIVFILMVLKYHEDLIN